MWGETIVSPVIHSESVSASTGVHSRGVFASGSTAWFVLGYTAVTKGSPGGHPVSPSADRFGSTADQHDQGLCDPDGGSSINCNRVVLPTTDPRWWVVTLLPESVWPVCHLDMR